MNNLMFGVSVTPIKVRDQVNPSLYKPAVGFLENIPGEFSEGRRCCRDRRLKS